MRFSILSFLIVILFVNLLVGLVFGVGGPLAYLLITLIALFVLPPFLWVGLIQTRGVKQSFFIGAIVSGIPHAVITAWMLSMVVAQGDLIDIWESNNWTEDADDYLFFNVMHLVFIFLGTMGGLVGMGSFVLLNGRRGAASD